MAFRMEQRFANGARLYKVTCIECGVVVAALADAAECKSARRAHRCGGRA